jgi:hypothetical protein
LVLPAVTLFVLVPAVVVLRALLNGGDFTPLALGQELGIVRAP